MLEQQDYQKLGKMIKGIVDESISKNNEVLEKQLDERFAKNNEILENRINETVTKSESFLLDEMERYYKMTQNDIERLEKKVDDIADYYRIKKSNDDACNQLFQLYHKQQAEIDEIREAIAL